MSVSNYGPYDVQSFEADVDMEGKTGYFAKITATGCDLCGDGERADGVIVNVERAGAGNDIGLMTTIGRKVPVAVGVAVAAGAELASGAASKGKTAVSTDFINGLTLDAGGADLDLVTCLFGARNGVKA